MMNIFYLSVASLVAYRVISAIKMWQISNLGVGTGTRVRRAVFQLFDLELYEILYLSHTMGLAGSSAPQRLLQILECIFESCPQVMVSVSISF